ncbi:MAG: hypothetical protein FJ253_09440, partial [Phycisphaerae bacterium]|nr:hypothetical protein [Phycisphaerae bacterium]
MDSRGSRAPRVRADGALSAGGGLFDAAAPIGLALVAVERGIDHAPDGLTYSIPPELDGLRAGERVIVPLGRGNRPSHGWVIRRLAQGEAPPIPSARIKPIEGRDPRSAPLPPTLVELA